MEKKNRKGDALGRASVQTGVASTRNTYLSEKKREAMQSPSFVFDLGLYTVPTFENTTGEQEEEEGALFFFFQKGNQTMEKKEKKGKRKGERGKRKGKRKKKRRI
mmetsp:Transcript_30537/g.79245  ORF Transcript_30537/g.79245 Transcript_30537/m.79245 type:complete len:105 (+) Transcript_30537:5685-5999(+)